MPATRLTMRKIREVLRLKFDCPSIYPKMWERQFVPTHRQTSDSTFSGCQKRKLTRSDPFSFLAKPEIF